METVILPIRNMCGYVVGKAQVTTNRLGNRYIQPLGAKNEFKKGGLICRQGYVHFGMVNPELSEHA